MRLKAAVVPVAVLVILFPLGYSVVRSVVSHGAEAAQPFLDKPDGRQERCVRDTTYMRFHHMTLLKQMRDQAVREGNMSLINQVRDAAVREGKGGATGLNTCRECHVSRERFCNQCHNAVNLHVDCFRCHYYP
jgi:hypothetical protein